MSMSTRSNVCSGDEPCAGGEGSENGTPWYSFANRFLLSLEGLEKKNITQLFPT